MIHAGQILPKNIINPVSDIILPIAWLIRQYDHEAESPGLAVYNAGSTFFPSGHYSTSFAVATALSQAYPKWSVVAPSYYPSDVFSGALSGTGTSLPLRPEFK